MSEAKGSPRHMLPPGPETPVPNVVTVGAAIQSWALCQARGVTGADAAAAFNLTPELARFVIQSHYWLYLDGDTICHEGE